jgi:hypothetical protein
MRTGSRSVWKVASGDCGLRAIAGALEPNGQAAVGSALLTLTPPLIAAAAGAIGPRASLPATSTPLI